MSATPNLQGQVQKLAASVKGIQDRMLGPVEGLLKMMEAPARRNGMSPADWIMSTSRGGAATAFAPDGTTFDMKGSSYGSFKGMGKINGYTKNDTRTEEEISVDDYLKAFVIAKDSSWRNEWAMKILNKLNIQGVETGDFGIRKTALAETSGVAGGYTVPPMFSEQLQAISVEANQLEPLCSKMPMTSLTLQVPSLDHTTSFGAGITPFLGGVQGTWNAEAAAIGESEPKFRQTELTAHQLSLYMIASNTLLADNAVGLDALLTSLMSQAMAWYKEYAFWQGTGTGQPLGILNAPALIAGTKTTTAKVFYLDVAGMYAKVYFPLIKSGRMGWFVHQSVIPQLLVLNDGSASTSTGRMLFVSIDQGGVKEPKWELLGIPVYVTEKLPALGTQGCIMLVDASKYLIGQRMDVQIDVSPHVKFLNNQMVWRVIIRCDGQPWLNNPITLADGAQTVSPFVTLTQ